MSSPEVTATTSRAGSGTLQLLGRDLDGNERALARIADAMSSVREGAKLTGQLLAFSRRQPLDPRVTDIGRLVTGMRELIAHTIGDAIEVEEVPALALKGKSEPVVAHRLLSAGGDHAYARRLDTPMVGRQTELGRLRDAFGQALRDRGDAARVDGDDMILGHERPPTSGRRRSASSRSAR